MKIKNLFVAMLAGAAMVSCSNEEFESGVNNGAIQAGDQAFVAVNIFAPGVTRAFDPGTEAESDVRDAIFLFLDGNYKGCAEPCYVTSDKLSWSTDGVADHQTKKGTTLVINGIEDEVPAYIVAILNPINKNAYNAKTSLKQLKAEYANYASAENGGYFVMSNAVYAADNKEEVVATPIALENIAHTKQELESTNYKPVSIQVERTVGKVTVNNLDAAIADLNANGLKETIDDSESMKLKFVLTGWEVLQNKATNLIKDIDASEWTIKNLTTWNWNDLSRERSYWANDNKSKGRHAYNVEKMSIPECGYKYVEETVNQNATVATDLNIESPYLLVSGKFVNENNQPVDTAYVRTAGEPAGIRLDYDGRRIKADGDDLAYVTVNIVDADGNVCPLADNEVTFEVTGTGFFKACANGDPTCIEPFAGPSMHAFNGKLTAIVQATEPAGKMYLKATSPGLKEAVLTVRSQY